MMADSGPWFRGADSPAFRCVAHGKAGRVDHRNPDYRQLPRRIDVLQYFISTHGARRVSPIPHSDCEFRYLTRLPVDVAQIWSSPKTIAVPMTVCHGALIEGGDGLRRWPSGCSGAHCRGCQGSVQSGIAPDRWFDFDERRACWRPTVSITSTYVRSSAAGPVTAFVQPVTGAIWDAGIKSISGGHSHRGLSIGEPGTS